MTENLPISSECWQAMCDTLGLEIEQVRGVTILTDAKLGAPVVMVEYPLTTAFFSLTGSAGMKILNVIKRYVLVPKV